MKSISFLSLALIIFFVLASCSKDSEDKQDQSPTGLLTAHGWRFFSYVQFGSQPAGYSCNLIQDCCKDDCWYFYKDGTYKKTIGTLKCNPNESDFYGVWSLPGTSGGSIDNGDYLSFTSIQATKLVLKFDYYGWGYNITYYECH
jgi:hypothetical protein